jgi:hypothetical protein
VIGYLECGNCGCTSTDEAMLMKPCPHCHPAPVLTADEIAMCKGIANTMVAEAWEHVLGYHPFPGSHLVRAESSASMTLMALEAYMKYGYPAGRT